MTVELEPAGGLGVTVDRFAERARVADGASDAERPPGGGPGPKAVLDALPDAVAIVNDAGAIAWANEAFDRRFGTARTGGDGDMVGCIAGPYARQIDGLMLLSAIRAGTGEVELTAFSADGLPFPCTARVATIDPATGDANRVVTLTDISERRRMQTELLVKAEAAAREKELLTAIAESLDRGIVVLDDAERVVLANAAASGLFGISAATARGRSLAELEIPGAVRGAWLTFLASPGSSGDRTVRAEIGGRAHTLLLQLHRTRSRDGAPLGSVLVVKALSGEGCESKAQADFLSGLSHELRTPLMSIQGFSKTLLDEPALDPALRSEFVSIVHREAGRLGRLIESVVRVCRADADASRQERVPVDMARQLPRWIDEAIREESIERGVVSSSCPDTPLRASVDASRLRQVLRQLLRNAVDHGASERGVRVKLSETDSTVRIEVRDWGPGVPANRLESIFEPFSRGPRPDSPGEPQGSGLGLFLCSRIVTRAGGAIRAEAGEGGGLRIVIELPR